MESKFALKDEGVEDMSSWNILLLSIAFDQPEIVKYLIRNCNVSIKGAGKRPT